MECGVITVLFKTAKDGLDSVMMIRILEEYRQELVVDLEAIAIRRNLIHGKKIE